MAENPAPDEVPFSRNEAQTNWRRSIVSRTFFPVRLHRNAETSASLSCAGFPFRHPFSILKLGNEDGLICSPFVPLLPKSLRLKRWLGRESNPRHEDFQSSALPTELPSRAKRSGKVGRIASRNKEKKNPVGGSERGALFSGEIRWCYEVELQSLRSSRRLNDSRRAV
jgi:hypothetical protein